MKYFREQLPTYCGGTEMVTLWDSLDCNARDAIDARWGELDFVGSGGCSALFLRKQDGKSPVLEKVTPLSLYPHLPGNVCGQIQVDYVGDYNFKVSQGGNHVSTFNLQPNEFFRVWLAMRERAVLRYFQEEPNSPLPKIVDSYFASQDGFVFHALCLEMDLGETLFDEVIPRKNHILPDGHDVCRVLYDAGLEVQRIFHKQNRIHGDLNGNNILVARDKSDRLYLRKIIDLATARSVSSIENDPVKYSLPDEIDLLKTINASQKSTFTPGLSAPELDPVSQSYTMDLTESVDTFSLSATALLCLAGMRLARGQCSDDCGVESRIYESFASLNYPSTLAKAVFYSLSRSPENRDINFLLAELLLASELSDDLPIASSIDDNGTRTFVLDTEEPLGVADTLDYVSNIEPSRLEKMMSRSQRGMGFVVRGQKISDMETFVPPVD